MNELATVNNDSGLDRSERISANLAIAKERLLDTKTDIERMEIRDFARKTYNIAVAAELNEIAVEAANLIQFTERKIVEANPPEQGKRNDKNFLPQEKEVSDNQIWKMRAAHTDISDSEFEDLQQGAIDSGEPLTRSKLQEITKDKKLNKSKSDKDKQKAELEKNRIVELPADKYQTVVIDPPWNVERVLLPSHNDAAFPYQQMTLDEIKSIKLPLADNAFVFLWTTHGYLRDSFSIIENDWGLEFVELLIWHKPNNNRPFANRPLTNSEFILMAKIGTPNLTSSKGFFTCFNGGKSNAPHSEKPEEFYDMIRGITPEPRVDMFNRREIEGFDNWGNESPE